MVTPLVDFELPALRPTPGPAALSELAAAFSAYPVMAEDIAKTAVKNRKDCNDLKVKYTEEKKPFDGFFFNGNPNQAKLDAVKAKYKELQQKIPECNFSI